MLNYKLLPKGTHTATYDKLSDEAKAKARQELINADLKHFNIEVDSFKKAIKGNLHYCVNDKYKIPFLIRIKKHINRTKVDLKYLENYILGNFCNFTLEGEYITYYS